MDVGTAAWVPLAVVAVLAGSALWVRRDARAQAGRGEPVTFSLGSLEVSTPEAWAIGSLVLWVIFMPLYLTCRNQPR